jgi:hypothetical protein
MSDLLNSASLVMIPSGYKEDIVYSAVPTDGSGDLSFTRASNGTRINSAGLVEVVSWNNCTNTETFSVTWTALSGASVTSNNTTAPNGTNTGARLAVPSTAFAGFIQTIPDNTQTLSIYAKKGTLDYLWVIHENISQLGASFNLDTGVVSFVASGHTASMESVGNGWYRCILSTTNSATWDYFQFGLSNASNSASSPSGGNAYIWGAQANLGSTAKPYFPTTDRLNVPRLTYQNGGGGCPSLLLEKQSTNSAFPSEDFSGYSGSAATISTNQATSPDGTTNADLIYPATSGNFAGKYKNIAKSTTGVVSCFVKQASKRYAIIGTDNNATYTCIFDLQTATVVYQATNYTGKIESFGNGWYRISAVYTSSTAADYPFIGVADNSSGGVVVDGTNGLYIWGFQYELNSSYPTSYIPTTSSSATRVADACFKTGISSLIGQSEGTMFCEFNAIGSYDTNNMICTLSDGTGNNRIFLNLTNGVGNLEAVITASGSTTVSFVGSTPSIGRHKIAIAYKSNDVVLYLDGTLLFTDTSVSIPATSKLNIGSYFNETFPFNSGINQAVLFKTRLTNSELASLTTI